jgi:hypothetical protein
MHHAQSNEDTAERVRGAQEGRVLDGCGSAGDQPYGYGSEYADPASALNYRGRGPKPKKVVVIDETSAKVVQEIFARFVRGQSISAIVRWLTSIQDTIPRIGKGDWHHQHVRRILTNPKYIGTWVYGKTTTVYDGHGKKKQVHARPDQQVTSVQRPQLRIIDQAMWDKAQERLLELLNVYGMKATGKKRGPAQHYRLLYPKTLLNGLVVCGRCGSRLVIQQGGNKRMGCPKHRSGTCKMSARVPYEKAEGMVLSLLESLLSSYPEWIEKAALHVASELKRLAQTMPQELNATRAQAREVEQQVDNLVLALAKGMDTPSVREKLNELEGQKLTLSAKLAELETTQSAPMQMPDEAWIFNQLKDLAGALKETVSTDSRPIRQILGPIVAEEVKPPKKKRGYIRLRFKLDGWAAVMQVMDGKLPQALQDLIAPQDPKALASGEFTLELGAPSSLDKWGPQIVKWREENVPWNEIARRTGMSPGNAWSAWERFRDEGQAA